MKRERKETETDLKGGTVTYRNGVKEIRIKDESYDWY